MSDCKTKLPGARVTVVIRDDSPMVFCGDAPTYRTVRIELTEEQRRALTLRRTGQDGEHSYYEEVSRLILEKDDD